MYRLRQTRMGIVLGVALVASAAACLAEPPREPLDFVPADALLCWSGRPLFDANEAAPASQPSTLQLLWELAARVAQEPLDRGTRLNLRVAELLGRAVGYPHAVALLDARARPTRTDPNAPRVDGLELALVVQCDGRPEPFLQVIQRAVDEQTSTGDGTLTNVQIGRWTCQELRDRRLPAWAVIAWGRLDGCFVLTLGSDVWQRLAQTAAGERSAISANEWFAGRRAAGPRVTRELEILVAAERLRSRLDPFVGGRASEFFRAWDAGDVNRMYWAFRMVGRSLHCWADYDIGGETYTRTYADPSLTTPRLRAAVPPDAQWAILELPVQRFIPRLVRGVLATQGEKPRLNIARHWAAIQAERRFDAERDILAHLDDRFVAHTYPPHPLRIPVALTILFQIRDEPAAVARALDELCAGWQTVLTAANADDAQAAPFTLHRDEDGVWYMRFGVGDSSWLGLAGPAWTVRDGFIILSWSPLALRQCIDTMNESRAAGPGLRTE